MKALRNLGLGAVVVAVVACPSRAQATDPDPWFGRDKALHFGASATIAAGGYAIGAAAFDARRDALLLGGALAAAAGIGKELLDLSGLGDPSWRDLAWDGMGTLAGLVVAWSVDCLVRGVSDGRPLFLTPRVETHAMGLSMPLRF